MLALIVFFPLLGFLVNGFWYACFQAPTGGKKAGAVVTGVIASAAVMASFVISLFLFLSLKAMPEEARSIEQMIFPWIHFGAFQLDFVFRLDPLSSLFTLVVSGVGALIHIYSIGYMGHDATPGKFFAYLNLFCFAMLVLVLGASLPILFLGWEGVGLCSYLLIGYWYADEEKARAGKKAFIVNRIGDFGFLLGMFLIFTTFGSFDFEALRKAIAHAHEAGLSADILPSTITAICLLLFVGCMGKSAQIPLYVWLPDAMAGPTPVSALIHAATMVTSGIYMVSRLNFLYSLSPVAMHVVAVIGVFTAFFAATIAFVQTDIKKVLAYSTISQLGYMFLACGVGAYSAGVFHVITHAFFKALLFLGAGSVIHGLHEEQDILKMGGLRSKMPKTFLVFAIAWLAICGIPPFSGFFSKDEILWQAFSSPYGSLLFWGMGALTAMMTAFYMTRLFSLTFLGSSRFEDKKIAHHGAVIAHLHKNHDTSQNRNGDAPAESGIHESPSVMIVPLQILAVLSLIGGFMGVPHFSWIEHWLAPVIPVHAEGLAESTSLAPALEWALMGVSVLIAIAGVFIALRLYSDLPKAEGLKRRFSVLHGLLKNKWYVDEIYEMLIIRPIYVFSVGLWKGFDIAVIDRVVLGFGRIAQWSGQTTRVIQTGAVQVYAFMLLMGLVATVGYLIYGLA